MKLSNLSIDDLLATYTRHVEDRCVQVESVKRHQFCLTIFLNYFEADVELKRLASLTPSDISDFTTNYGQSHGIDCRRHMRTMLRCFLRFIHRQQLIPKDLTAAVPSIRTYRFSRAPRPISEQAIEQLLDTINCEEEAGCRDFAIIQLLRIYGIRAVQLRYLTIADIDWHADAIRFPAAKGGHAITVPMLPEAGNALTNYLSGFRKSHSGHRELFLTSTPPYKPLGASTIVRIQ